MAHYLHGASVRLRPSGYDFDVADNERAVKPSQPTDRVSRVSADHPHRPPLGIVGPQPFGPLGYHLAYGSVLERCCDVGS